VNFLRIFLKEVYDDGGENLYNTQLPGLNAYGIKVTMSITKLNKMLTKDQMMMTSLLQQ
jgi:hypothetical protein